MYTPISNFSNDLTPVPIKQETYEGPKSYVMSNTTLTLFCHDVAMQIQVDIYDERDPFRSVSIG